MPRYSITIDLNGHSPEQIVRTLRLVFGDSIARGSKITVSGEPDLRADSCRMAGHFGCVHWTDYDVEGRFQELDVPATRELLDEVKDRIRHIDDGMTELGWEVIENAILDAVDTASAGP